MTNILAWLAANWLMLGIALAFLLFLIIGTAWAVCFCFWHWVIEAEREPEALPIAYGDSTHLPDNYWQAVARKEAKRRAA